MISALQTLSTQAKSSSSQDFCSQAAVKALRGSHRSPSNESKPDLDCVHDLNHSSHIQQHWHCQRIQRHLATGFLTLQSGCCCLATDVASPCVLFACFNLCLSVCFVPSICSQLGPGSRVVLHVTHPSDSWLQEQDIQSCTAPQQHQ